ncbi:hypothetical protein P7K49_013375 [Saguinus oedipus]|uniref:60S ribosomal protein L3 n=1 Tax=Saguinus oedipus TaxID=9490 RepID=A0ABQ9VGJ7_SAGOE|nr:hypothetical protein P7K49_013375 [Saguinus oedipus]
MNSFEQKAKFENISIYEMLANEGGKASESELKSFMEVLRSQAWVPRLPASELHSRHHGKGKSFPKDDPSKPVHLTVFLGYKAGMTHIVQEVSRLGFEENKKEVVEAATIVEMPPLWLWALAARNGRKDDKKKLEQDFSIMRRHCQVIHVTAHTHMHLLPPQQRAPLMENQVSRGTVAKRLDWAWERLQQQAPVNQVTGQNEMTDIFGVTKAKTTKGSQAVGTPISCPVKPTEACSRWPGLGHGILPVWPSLWHVLGRRATITALRSTRRSIRKISQGYLIKETDRFRTMRLCGGNQEAKTCAHPPPAFAGKTKRQALKKIDLKFIDTTSKFGPGCFQTMEEKKVFMEPLKKDHIAKEDGA